MKPVILKLARDDLKEIHEHLSEFGVSTAKKFRTSFEKFCACVASTPYVYSQYVYNPKYRRAVIEYDYLVLFQVEDSSGRVRVFRVLRGMRDIRSLLDDE